MTRYKCTVPLYLLLERARACYCGLYMVASLTAGEDIRFLATVRSVTNVIANGRRKSSQCHIVTRVMLDQERPQDLGHLCALL